MIESENKNTIKVEEPKKEEVKKEEPTVVPVKEEKKSGIGSFLIIALVIGGVIGAGYYFKVVKAKEDKMLEDFEFWVDTLDPQTILCKYPKIFESNYLK